MSFSFQLVNAMFWFRGAPAWRWVLLYLHTAHTCIYTQDIFFCRQNSFLMIQSCQETAFSVSFSCQLVNVMFWFRGAPAWRWVLLYLHTAHIYTQNIFFCGQNSFLMIHSCQETVFSMSFSCQRVNVMSCFQRGPSVEVRTISH